MISLLDVNVLLALFDGAHARHEAAHDWFDSNRHTGWATCPITESALVRILSSPAYPGRHGSIDDLAERLVMFRESGDHVFWPDDVSLAHPQVFRFHHIIGHRQLTDAYLLALAVRFGGRLATFDGKIRRSAVARAYARSMVVLEA